MYSQVNGSSSTDGGDVAMQELSVENAQESNPTPTSDSSSSVTSSSSSYGSDGQFAQGRDYDEAGDSSEKPSNEKLLCIAFASFQSFALLQIGAAYIAGSEAMMGDSAAMMVDALTYLFNLLAERRKSQFREELLETKRLSSDTQVYAAKALCCRKRSLQMELLPPIISVSTLLTVTGFVSYFAIKVLILDQNRAISEQKNPNVTLMLAFSCGNLVLDVINVTCFAKAQHALGYNTDVPVPEHDVSSDENGSFDSDKKESRKYGVASGGEKPRTRNKRGRSSDTKSLIRNDSLATSPTNETQKGNSSTMQPLEIEMIASHVLGDHDDDGDNHDHANLNMCSAYTHVFADTLRSFAVIIAGGIAMIVESVTPEEADATAAVIVSALILLSLIPLISGLVATATSLREVIVLERKQKVLAMSAEHCTGQV